MIIIQLDSEQLNQVIQNAVRKVLSDQIIASRKNNGSESEHPLTVQETANFLDLAVPTIYGLVSRREIPFSKKGKRLYFSKKELTEWIQTGRRKTVGEIEKEVLR